MLADRRQWIPLPFIFATEGTEITEKKFSLCVPCGLCGYLTLTFFELDQV